MMTFLLEMRRAYFKLIHLMNRFSSIYPQSFELGLLDPAYHYPLPLLTLTESCIS